MMTTPEEWQRRAENARLGASNKRALAAVQRGWARDSDKHAAFFDAREQRCLELAEESRRVA